MEFTDILKRRMSIRDFKDQPVDPQLLKQIVQEAQTAPSWENSQPWKVYIATGDIMKQIRQTHLQKSLDGVKGHADLPVKHRKDWGAFSVQNITAWEQEVNADPNNANFAQANIQLWNAPVMAYLTIPKTAPAWSIYDLGAFGQSLVLSATNHGVDTIIAYENIKYPDEVRSVFDIADDEMIAMGIALGYRSDDQINHYRSHRLPVDDILTIK